MRTSALHDLHLSRVPDMSGWTSVAGMRLPAAFPNQADPAALALADASHRARAGVKGPGAAAYLAALGLPVPAEPNRWVAISNGGLIARLGLTEFFVEDDGSASRQIGAVPVPAGVYPVPRTDTALVLAGQGAIEVLLQTCNINFNALDGSSGELVLTSMAGVGVLVIPQRAGDISLYRIWCDPSFGPYLYRTLLGIVEELGGGPLGVDGLAGLDSPAPTPSAPNPNPRDP